MKQKLLLLFALFSFALFFSCSKSDSGSSAPKSITITAVSPDKLYNGTQVTITGENFSADTATITLWLDSKIIPVTAASTSSVTFTIPLDFVTSGQKTCTLQLDVKEQMVVRTATRTVTISYLEPKGWYYAAAIPIPAGISNPLFKQVIFPTDSIGFALREKYLYGTTDGGITWTGDNNNGGFGLGKAVASSDGKNVWIESAGDALVATNGINTWTAPTGSNYNSIVTGLYTTAAANGLVALVCGKLYDINCTFAGAGIKYQSSLYINDHSNVWQKMSALDKNNLIITGVNNKIVVEKAGVFTEGDLSAVSGNSNVVDLQMVDANTIFLVNGSDELLKYSSNTWTKLTQPANAVYFISTTTGYIAYNNKILKTTDGGATWKDEFTLRSTEKIGSIYARNGKIWALGNDATQGIVVKYNP